MKDANRTYSGLSRNCVTCHEDKHKGQLGANCLQCHNTQDWKDARSFDHSKTKFALTGLHRQVTCQKCHAPGADGVPKYVGLKFDRCAACHNDPHRGEFKQGCESCHSTSTWKQSSFVAQFDHSKTKYPLAGKHLEVRLRRLSSRRRLQDPHRPQCLRRLPQARSTQRAVPGAGRRRTLRILPLGGRLQTSEIFRRRSQSHGVSFAGEARRSGLREVPCAGRPRHRIQDQNVRLRRPATRTYTATSSPAHLTSIVANSATTRPRSTLRDSILARHQQTRFVLTGSHVAVACIDCHKPAESGRSALYHFDVLNCTTCHADPHKGQFAARMASADGNGRPLGCEACHSTKTWSDLSRFDHGTTKFVLTGAHRAVDCATLSSSAQPGTQAAEREFHVSAISSARTATKNLTVCNSHAEEPLPIARIAT